MVGRSRKWDLRPYQQNCAPLRSWNPTNFNVSKPNNVGMAFQWKSGNTGNKFRQIGTVYP